MKAVGIIVEYNPFHNGHAYHVQQTKEKTSADCIVAVMSTSFTQRGEPALVPKWERANMALAGGVDLVVELPYPFAVQTADVFANGAISILDALLCETVCFGSEDGRIAPFEQTIAALMNDKGKHDAALKSYLQSGMSYAKAYALALKALGATLDVSKPNNILGFHYVKAISEQQSAIKPVTIERIVADYHEQTLQAHEMIASATSIRRHMKDGIATICPYVPKTTVAELRRYYETFGTFHEWEQYFPLLKYRLLTMSVAELRQIAEVEEGIEHRLKKASDEATSFQSFIHLVKTKRYTWTRLQRICTHIVTHTTKKELADACRTKRATYVRPLAMNETGRRYLQTIKKASKLPIITKRKHLERHAIYQLEKKAAAAHASILPEPLWTKALRREYATAPLR